MRETVKIFGLTENELKTKVQAQYSATHFAKTPIYG